MNWARARRWRDPTSAFLAEDKAYEPAYSVMRTEQANAFLEHTINNTLPLHCQTEDRIWKNDLFTSSLLAALGVAAGRQWRKAVVVAATTYPPNKINGLFAFVLTPLLIILFFAAGRITMLTMPGAWVA
ncbi:hypothetical protein N7520_011113 [Penicillium odoratum]|uniref:uncharacterized protein n=1 Tax=Penicillium odoratum TaxID=1167516 RepID=UPI0025498C1A|nr:uncharacterized protein N7520_011113 [Penicillium odoratum]KAJ5745931.1 hypothetical protein N7520_011113 [Penicillium odoratum]